MEECRETPRDAIGDSDWDRIMRGRPHAQVRAKAHKKWRPNDAAVRMRTGWRSLCKIRRLRSSESVRKWSVRFRAGRESVRPGQANTVITSDLIDKVDDLVRSDRRVTLRMLEMKVDVSYGTVWTIVHDRLRFWKVCAA
ncbi:hypothetical protein TNIN_251401 [Trichonephila inaurata madagascariensis]|uniref:Transposase n=1 Tax=Trichonephila inaurata madagascariensis TaxID=2747483 RepID=A0A8X6IIQ4_9ARAC|nr:hypothetical protein TNIN_251401 [Trichonephila inaurata madagascariensis]